MLSSALGTLPEGAMTYDKDTYEITFTRKGAILCLETLGLLEKGSTPPV